VTTLKKNVVYKIPWEGGGFWFWHNVVFSIGNGGDFPLSLFQIVFFLEVILKMANKQTN
jgi:hypothetical protein